MKKGFRQEISSVASTMLNGSVNAVHEKNLSALEQDAPDETIQKQENLDKPIAAKARGKKPYGEDKKKKLMSIRLDAVTRKQLEEIAYENHVTQTRMVELLINQAYQTRQMDH